MQENLKKKKKITKKLREWEKERAFFCEGKCVKNGRVNEKFIVRVCE